VPGHVKFALGNLQRILRNIRLPREIKLRWNIYGDLSFELCSNIAPSQSVPVIVHGERGNEAKFMKWGLVPSWAPDR
jgi:putative SOS response-associated peptidase YedK